MATFTPQSYAKWLDKWYGSGFDLAVIDGAMTAVEADAAESRARAPHKSGKLAASIRTVRPRVGAAIKRGLIRFRLTAGKRGISPSSVPYAQVMQTGRVSQFAPGPSRGQTKTAAHRIEARGGSYSSGGFSITGRLRFQVSGKWVMVPAVEHKGSRLRAHNYLRFREDRVAGAINSSVQHSLDKAA